MIIYKCIILIVLTILTLINKIISKHYLLFNWYCKKFFDLKKHFTQKELEYIYNIFNHSFIEIFNTTMDKKRLSYISFSHKIYNVTHKIESGRFSIGSIMLPNLAFYHALEILKERHIKLPKYLLTKDYIFGGLGWDFHKNYFKIYFRCINKNFLNIHSDIIKDIKSKQINKIKKLYKTNKYWKEGIISFTYLNNILYEKKLYVYPKYTKNKAITYLLSNKRDIIKQIDINNLKKVTKVETQLMKEYKKLNIELDTISKTKNSRIYYFPK